MSSAHVSEAELTALLDICRRATATGAVILKKAYERSVSKRGEFDTSVEASAKGELGDMVTETDVAAEKAMRELLTQLRPDDLVVGEEFPDSTGNNPQFRWSLDPLDGTSNFVKSLPHFGSSVGVQHIPSGIWLAGSVNAPIIDKEYFASLGQGSWLSYGGKVRQITGPIPNQQPILFGTGFSYDPEARAQQYAALPKLMEKFNDIRSVGSAALGLCLAAEGAVDAFVESDLYEFDWAAGALIAEEAGLIVKRPESFRGGISAYPAQLLPEE